MHGAVRFTLDEVEQTMFRTNGVGLMMAVAGLLVAGVPADGSGGLPANTWTGAGGDRSWENGQNWSLGVPDMFHAVVIPTGSGQIRITTEDAKSVGSLTVEPSLVAAEVRIDVVGFDPAANREVGITINAMAGPIVIGAGSAIRGVASGLDANVGRAGSDISLSSVESITIARQPGAGGKSAEVRGGAGGGTSIGTHTAGRGGDVTLTAPVINVDGYVYGGSAGRGDSGTPAAQRGGNVVLSALSGTVTNRGTVQGGFGWRGRGGDVTITAATLLNLHFPAKIGPTSISGGSAVRNTAAGDGPGGNVSLTVAGSLDNFGGLAGGQFWASSILGGEGVAGSGATAPGRGGNITIDAVRVRNGRGEGPTGLAGVIRGGRNGGGANGPSNSSPGGDVTIRAICEVDIGSVIEGGPGAPMSSRGAVQITDVQRLVGRPLDRLFGSVVGISFASICGGLFTEEDPILDLRGAGPNVIMADESICITMGEEGVVDLRDNPAGTSVIVVHDAEGWINLAMNPFLLLVDGGVALEDLTTPASSPAEVDSGCAGPPEPCIGDLTGDGTVSGDDLLLLLAAWGACPEGPSCPADLNGDAVVNSEDLLLLLSHWGKCS